MEVITLPFAFFYAVSSFLLAILFTFLALKVFEAYTGKLREWEEIRKGNLAAAVEFAGVVGALGIGGGAAVSAFGSSLAPSGDPLLYFLYALAKLLFFLLLVFGGILLVERIVEEAMTDLSIDVEEEIKKGNIAVATVLSSIFIAASWVLAGMFPGLSRLLG